MNLTSRATTNTAALRRRVPMVASIACAFVALPLLAAPASATSSAGGLRDWVTTSYWATSQPSLDAGVAMTTAAVDGADAHSPRITLVRVPVEGHAQPGGAITYTLTLSN